MAKLAKVDIWSVALDRIGENDPVENENEVREAVRACKRHYDRCRLEVLEAFWWRFATAQAKPALLAGKRFGWEYAYAVPEGCVAPRALLYGGQRQAQYGVRNRLPFDVQADDAGENSIIVTDVAPADFDTLEFTRDIEATGAFPPGFVNALEWRLAAELALALKKDRALFDRIMHPDSGDFVVAFRRAAAAELTGRQPDPEPDCDLLQARK